MPCRQYLCMKWYHLLHSNLTHTILHSPFCFWGFSPVNLPQFWVGCIQETTDTVSWGLGFLQCIGSTVWHTSPYPTELLGNDHLFHSWDYWNKEEKAFSANDSSLLLPLQATASDNPRSWRPSDFHHWRRKTSFIFQVFTVLPKRCISATSKGKQESLRALQSLLGKGWKRFHLSA